MFKTSLDDAKKAYFEAISAHHKNEGEYAKARKELQESIGDTVLIGSIEGMEYHEAAFQWMLQFWAEYKERVKQIRNEEKNG